MSSTYSSSLRVELIGSGDQAGTWGTTTDNNFAFIFDTAIAGINTVTISSVNQALTYVNGPTSTAALNQSIYAILKLNSAAATSAIYAPPVSKQYIIWNNSSFTITIYNSTVIGNTTAAGAGIAIATGNKVMVWSDGTDFYAVQAQNLTGTLAIVNGGTGQTTQQTAINALTGAQTNNRVLRSDGTNSTLSQVVLTTDVTGTLPLANGGTGATTLAGAGIATLTGTETLTNKTLTSPTLTAPVLGTPSSGNLANCTFPTLNQNTSGTAAGLSATLALGSGGTGQTTAANAGSALGAIGVGQTTQDVSASRAAGTTYTNSTGRPIMVYISTVNAGPSSTTSQEITVDGISILFGGTQSNRRAAYTFIVPAGSTYSLTTGDTIQNWCELRV